MQSDPELSPIPLNVYETESPNTPGGTNFAEPGPTDFGLTPDSPLLVSDPLPNNPQIAVYTVPLPNPTGETGFDPTLRVTQDPGDTPQDRTQLPVDIPTVLQDSCNECLLKWRQTIRANDPGTNEDPFVNYLIQVANIQNAGRLVKCLLAQREQLSHPINPQDLLNLIQSGSLQALIKDACIQEKR
jgi:hypothetical protein